MLANAFRLSRFGLASAGFVGLLCLASAPAAQAQVTIMLDNPNQTVAVPSSGSITLNFTGTLTYAPGSTFTGHSLDYAFNASVSSDLITNFGSVNFNAPNGGGSVRGILFTASVPSSTLSGFYGFNAGGTSPSTFQVGVTGVSGTTAVAPFSVTVTPAAVPEPGSVALLIGLATTGAGFLARRRKQARHAA